MSEWQGYLLSCPGQLKKYKKLTQQWPNKDTKQHDHNKQILSTYQFEFTLVRSTGDCMMKIVDCSRSLHGFSSGYKVLFPWAHISSSATLQLKSNAVSIVKTKSCWCLII